MEARQSFVSVVYTELVRRKVLRTVGAYAVAVFAVLQLMDAAVEPLRLPDWLPTLVVIGPLARHAAERDEVAGSGFGLAKFPG